MEKITKEELMENLGGKVLSDEELEKVSGGDAAEFKECKDSYTSQGYSEYQATAWCKKYGGGF